MDLWLGLTIILFCVLGIAGIYYSSDSSKVLDSTPTPTRVYAVIWFAPYSKVWEVFGTTRDINEALLWGESISRHSVTWYITSYWESI